MRQAGRGFHASGGSVLLCILVIHTTIRIAHSDEYGVPIEIKIWDTGRTPLAHMVDVTNGFGLKVLAEHNFLNENNIAFSPYGLMGILVALYEGIDGESSFQVQQAMQLPWNRNVMRVGFRDIHRTLKTYFVPEEGFLAGLALNNENVTFNESYKKILRFYGFDLDNNEQIPTLAPSNDTSTNSTAEATTTMPAADTVSPTMTTAEATTMAATTREETTPSSNPSAETLNDIDIRGPTTENSPSSAPTAESTTTMPVAAEETTVQTTTQAEETTITIAPTTTVTAEETTPSAERIDTETIPIQMSSTMTVTDEPTENNEVETSSGTSSTVTSETTAVSIPDGATTVTTENTLSTISETTVEVTASTTVSDEMTTVASTIETLERRKRSLLDFLYTNSPLYGPVIQADDYLFHRSYDIPIPSGPETLNTNFNGNNMFLANGLRRVQANYMHYDTILEHAYLPHLEAAALRLPLDSDRYYLLVILPLRGGPPELGRLLARMARESDLSDVCSALRYRRVRAIVPSFTVKGHITLTTDLQKLGMRDVFEPRQRDFTPMTYQAGVYVRSIEQSVSVAIRKYRADANNSGRYVANQHPVTFAATYPFLYFVMDASIHVSLMAGKMVDPLNSRIL